MHPNTHITDKNNENDEKTTLCTLERIAAALERIADNMDAAKVLEERRRRNREHMAAVRGKSVCTQTPAERNEEGKEENPPCTPLKEKGEEEKKDTPQRVRAREDGFDDLFDRFWRAYPGPRKTDKRKCRAKFAAILRESGEPDAMLNRILDGIERWRKSRDWTEDGGDYICAPVSECYVANMRHLNDLLRRKLDRDKVSDEETVAAWGEQYEWIVRNGLRPAITRCNGARREPLPFEALHAVAMEAYARIIKFRKEIEK